MKVKKLIAAIATISTMSSLASSFSVNATYNVLLGDANNDGYVTIADAAAISQYLGGYYQVSPYCFTAMDINQDCIVDKTDSYIIGYKVAYSLPNTTVSKELYTAPDCSTIRYIKYTCSSGITSEYLLTPRNSLHSTTGTQNLNTLYSNVRDYENTNVVRLIAKDSSDNIKWWGSGFIVDQNTIATAAHCVFDKRNNSFVSKIEIEIYNQNGEVDEDNQINLINTLTADSYHIPKLYKVITSNVVDNYDYALIHVDYNLSQYGIWDIGIAADECMDTTDSVTTSGFTNLISPPARYYSTGTIYDFRTDDDETHNYPNHRLAVNCSSVGGKSGGVMYYTSSYNNVVNKSAVAILTGGTDSRTWGVRMNPTLLNFYLQNDNI